MSWFGIFVIVGLCCLALFLYFRFFKLYKMRNVIFIDGTLGSGKSFLSVALAVRLYKKMLRQYKVKKLFLGFLAPFRKEWKKAYESLEKPLLYSNIKLRDIEHVKVTRDLLTRQNYRFAYKSVLLLDEITLMVDQMCFKDHVLNERLVEFWKLFRHETRGGYVIVNSSSTSDMHFCLKNVLSDYLYIHHRTKLPFFTALKVQEMAYTNDAGGGTIMNVRNGDVEDTLRTMLVFNHKRYDTYCYSIYTDGLPVWERVQRFTKDDSLKDDDLVSWKVYTFLMENIDKKKDQNKKEKDNNASSTQA